MAAPYADVLPAEDAISFSRQSYNGSVLDYNNVVTTFPGNVFAKQLGVAKRPMLSVDAVDRIVPKVSFAS